MKHLKTIKWKRKIYLLVNKINNKNLTFKNIKIMFTQKLSMSCTEEQYKNYLMDEISKIGYKEVCIGQWEDNEVILNNYLGETGEVGNSGRLSVKDYGRTYYKEFNAPLFLAIAAMTDKEYGGYGEHWTPIDERCNWTVGKLYKAIRPVNKEGALVDDRGSQNGFSMAPFKNIRKATKDEIIKYYTNTVMESKTFETTREDMKSIYNIACSDWKTKIEGMIKDYQESPFSNNVTLPERVVKLMFEAATPIQLVTLEKVFPEFRKDNNAFVGEFDSSVLEDINKTLFGEANFIRIGYGWVPSELEHLQSKCFAVDEHCEVILHKRTSDGITLIEFRKK